LRHGLSSLADRFGFAIVYPQQQPANNPKNCFSWFLPGDTARGHGEARSIHAMVEHAIAKFASDRTRIFVTGLSAGGAMASVMLATYPDLFAGGAIIAGLPYGCARNAQQAFEAMFAAKGDCAEVLGDRVRAASGHCGPWPKISIWHGAADPIVKPANCDAIVRQWTNVHGLSDSPAYEERIGSHTRQVWSDEQGEPLIEVFSIDNMAHGVPLGIATDGESCGAAGAFFLDAGISSTHHIARFWGLHKSAVKKRRVAASAPAPSALPRDQGARAMVRTRPETSQASAEDTAGARDEPQSHHAFDPNRVIAAAFQAAGLAAPPKTAPGASSRIDPAPIIAAALKAAGLTKN